MNTDLSLSNNMQEDRLQKNLTKSQKTGFVLLFLFSLLAVASIFLQIRNNIYNPFAVTISKEELEYIQNLQYDENTKLQQIDTDQDGLSDYDEINFYTTSRYIPDTDSDGLTDKEEIDLGKDPLCPEGEVCVEETIISSSTENIGSSSLIENMQTPEDILLNTQINNLQNTALSNEDFNKLLADPSSLREMLISTGKITEKDLVGVDDNTLLELAKNLINTQFTTSTILNNTTTTQ